MADFYAPDARVILEVDGLAHDFRVERDAVRDEWLRGQGFVVVRVAAAEVLKELDAVVDGVVRLILAGRSGLALRFCPSTTLRAVPLPMASPQGGFFRTAPILPVA